MDMDVDWNTIGDGCDWDEVESDMGIDEVEDGSDIVHEDGCNEKYMQNAANARASDVEERGPIHNGEMYEDLSDIISRGIPKESASFKPNPHISLIPSDTENLANQSTPPDSETTLKSRLIINPNKAGTQYVDKAKVAQIVYEASKASLSTILLPHPDCSNSNM